MSRPNRKCVKDFLLSFFGRRKLEVSTLKGFFDLVKKIALIEVNLKTDQDHAELDSASYND